MTAVTAIGRYCDWLALEGKSPGTIYGRHGALSRARDAIGRGLLADADLHDLLRWRMSLAGRSDNYVLAQVSHIRCFFAWLVQAEYRPDNPALRLPVPRKTEMVPRPIGENELLDVLDSASARIRLWLVLAAWMGMRACEIGPLRRSSIRDTASPPHILIRADATKGHAEAVIPLAHPFVVAEIAAAGLPVTGWCFPRLDDLPGHVSAHRVSDLCNEHIHACGYADTLHSLRHRAGTAVLRATGNVRTAQRFLRHKRLETTAIYTLVVDDEVAAAAAAIPAPRRLRAASLGAAA